MLIGLSAYLLAGLAPVAAFECLVLPVFFFFRLRPSRFYLLLDPGILSLYLVVSTLFIRNKSLALRGVKVQLIAWGDLKL